jgi:hypothetical protein
VRLVKTSANCYTCDREAEVGGCHLESASPPTILGCQKTYIAQFAEAEGFAHVHFHIVARPAELPPDLRGPQIFQMLGHADRPQVSEQRMDDIARELAAQLA